MDEFYLQDDFLHFFVRRLKLSYENKHDFTSIVIRVFGVHERNQITDSLQECSETLASVCSYTFPERLQNRVEALDTVGRCSFGECGYRQRSNRTHFLLFVDQTWCTKVNR